MSCVSLRDGVVGIWEIIFSQLVSTEVVILVIMKLSAMGACCAQIRRHVSLLYLRDCFKSTSTSLGRIPEKHCGKPGLSNAIDGMRLAGRQRGRRNVSIKLGQVQDFINAGKMKLTPFHAPILN